jgi:hypothetical protein
MAENPSESVAKVGERFVEGVPGIALVSVALGVLLPKLLPRAEFRDLLPIAGFVIAYLLSFVGHYVDGWLFDPVWSVPGSKPWQDFFEVILPARTLVKCRGQLALKWRRPRLGIFAKAKQVTHGTELWEKKIKWPLELSKAARSFLLFDLILLIWSVSRLALVVLGVSLAASALAWVLANRGDRWRRRSWWTFATNLVYTAAGTSLGAVLVQGFVPLAMPADDSARRLIASEIFLMLEFSWLYCWLRLIHIRRMYQAALDMKCEEKGGFFCAGLKVFALRNVLVRTRDASIQPHQILQAEVWLLATALMHVRLFRQSGSEDLANIEEVQLSVNGKAVREPTAGLALPETPTWPNDIQWDLIVTLVSQAGDDARKLKESLDGIL